MLFGLDTLSLIAQPLYASTLVAIATMKSHALTALQPQIEFWPQTNVYVQMGTWT
jgi:hypothetical protein